MELIDKALDKYNVIAVFSLFSGGHDSLVATHIAGQHPRFTGVLHVDTTTGLRETRQFVEETCKDHDWKLFVHKPFMPFTSLLMKYGFPGPALHSIVYERLKNRTISAFLKNIRKELKAEKNDKIMLISGVRTQESDRRAEIQTEAHTEGSRLWLPIIHNFSAIDVADYIQDYNLERSPVKDLIHMSGECFCGCFSRETELEELKYWFPYQYERILKWRQLVKMARDVQLWECKQGLSTEASIKEIGCNYGGPKGAAPPEQGSFLPLCMDCVKRGRNGSR